jgi:hypothetical protein
MKHKKGDENGEGVEKERKKMCGLKKVTKKSYLTGNPVFSIGAIKKREKNFWT